MIGGYSYNGGTFTVPNYTSTWVSSNSNQDYLYPSAPAAEPKPPSDVDWLREQVEEIAAIGRAA